MEGSSHLLDDEILQYEHSHYNGIGDAGVARKLNFNDEENFTDDED